MLRSLLVALVLIGLPSKLVWSDEPAKLEQVFAGLDQPTAVAIQPKTETVFIAESAARKIVRAVDGKPHDVVTGFATANVRLGTTEFAAGPLGITFLDGKTLAVVGAGPEAGPQRLSIISVPEPKKPALSASTTKFPPQALPEEGRGAGEENFRSVAATSAGVYIAVHGNDAQAGGGLIAKAEVNGTKVGELTRFVPGSDKQRLSPAGLAISPRGEVVVAYQGEHNTPGDSQLAFFNSKSGQQLLSLQTGLSDIVALAYSPKGQLYALDAAGHDPAQAGLFQLVADYNSGKTRIKPIKIATLRQPSSLAFASDGTLYITTLGAAPEGKLWKIAPGL